MDHREGSGIPALLLAEKLGQPPVHQQHLAEVPEHDVLGFDIAMDHPLAVGECQRIGHFLEDGEQFPQRMVAEGVFLPLRHLVEHLLQGDSVHELHRVKDLIVLVHAQLVERDDPRVLEPRHDPGLGHKPRHTVLVGRVQHHFHRHRAFGRGLARAENRSHRPICHGPADLITPTVQGVVRQQPAQRGCSRRQGGVRGNGLEPADFHRGGADLQELVGPEPGGFGNSRPLEARAVAGTEVLHQDPVEIDGEPDVFSRDEVRIQGQVGLIGSAEDVFAGRNDLVEQDPTVGVARHNLGLGNLHPGSRAIFMQASVWVGESRGYWEKPGFLASNPTSEADP